MPSDDRAAELAVCHTVVSIPVCHGNCSGANDRSTLELAKPRLELSRTLTLSMLGAEDFTVELDEASPVATLSCASHILTCTATEQVWGVVQKAGDFSLSPWKRQAGSRLTGASSTFSLFALCPGQLRPAHFRCNSVLGLTPPLLKVALKVCSCLHRPLRVQVGLPSLWQKQDSAPPHGYQVIPKPEDSKRDGLHHGRGTAPIAHSRQSREAASPSKQSVLEVAAIRTLPECYIISSGLDHKEMPCSRGYLGVVWGPRSCVIAGT